MNTIRVRFAPSPTGHLHIGGVRTALFNFLFAKKYKGDFILRIEDTDKARSSVEYEEEILKSLNWLGLDWDEGPDKKGEFGPYRQQDRLNRYRSFSDLLIKNGFAYRCFCTPEVLQKERQERIKNNLPQKYSGKCRNLSENEIAKNIANNKSFVVRYKNNVGNDIVFDDIIKGRITINTSELDDFIIVRADGLPTYNFSAVVDDSLMKISHVLRGDDHISNTPKQILLYKSLNLPVPIFGHLPMILGQDGQRLSKRHGATAITEFIKQGYLKEAILNFVALLGWSPEDESEKNSLEDLIQKFDINRVSKSSSIFDYTKLNWLNGLYIRDLSFEEYKTFAIKILVDSDYSLELYSTDKLNKIISISQRYCHTLNDILEVTKIFFADNNSFCFSDVSEIIDTKIALELFTFIRDELYDIKEITLENFGGIIKKAGKSIGIKGKALYMPIRILLTSSDSGPELKDIVYIFGRDKIIEKFNNAINKDTNK